MKKILAIIALIITFFIIYFLQTNFFTWFTIAGVMPNLFIIFIIFIGLFIGKKVGFIFGIIIGIYLDAVLGNSIGISAALLGLLGLLAEYIDKSFSKNSRITIMLIVIGGTIIFELGIYIFRIISYGISIEILAFVKTLLIEILFNLILIIIIYPIIQKTGYMLEDLFKTKKIMTRYF